MGKAIVLLSGGADSATCLGVAAREGLDLYALTIDYGQSHKIEIEMAKRQAENFKVKEHLVLDLDLRRLARSALTGGMEVPKRSEGEGIESGIPVTYVPARNTIFLSLALGWAETIGTGDIFIGVNAVDYSGYPDCRPDFIESFEKTARLATKMGVEHERELEIHTPLIHLSKGEIFKLGSEVGVDFSKTHSCYSPVGDMACGECDSCRLRLKGFADAGLTDPLVYNRE